MSDYSEATAALDKASEIIDEARTETDHARRMGTLLLLKETANQAVKFHRRAYLAAAGFNDKDQPPLPLDGDGSTTHGKH